MTNLLSDACKNGIFSKFIHGKPSFGRSGGGGFLGLTVHELGKLTWVCTGMQCFQPQMWMLKYHTFIFWMSELVQNKDNFTG